MKAIQMVKWIGSQCYQKVRVALIWTLEWYAILKKRKMYQNVQWTPEQKAEFNEFWKKNYGKKISSRWHKMYQSINGTFDVQYFPEILNTTKLEPKLNSKPYVNVFSDKALTEVFYGGIDGAKCPETLVVHCGSYIYNQNRQIISLQQMYDILESAGEIVIKPSVGSGSGQGIIFANVIKGIDIVTNRHLKEIISKLTFKQYIVQRKLKQHQVFAAINPSSINTLRITTYILNDTIYHMPICIRMGIKGSMVDNIHAGGLVVGVSDDGILSQYAYRLGYTDSKDRYKVHPDTGIEFAGYILPYISDVIVLAKQLHGRTPHIGIISWDYMVDNDNEIVLIEANYNGTSAWFPQIAHGKSLFDENILEILQLLRK